MRESACVDLVVRVPCSVFSRIRLGRRRVPAGGAQASASSSRSAALRAGKARGWCQTHWPARGTTSVPTAGGPLLPEMRRRTPQTYAQAIEGWGAAQSRQHRAAAGGAAEAGRASASAPPKLQFHMGGQPLTSSTTIFQASWGQASKRPAWPPNVFPCRSSSRELLVRVLRVLAAQRKASCGPCAGHPACKAAGAGQWRSGRRRTPAAAAPVGRSAHRDVQHVPGAG
jgi:hypothetical protein